MNNVYLNLLRETDYGHGDHWRPVWHDIDIALYGGNTLMDVGCGRGGLMRHAQGQGYRARGCDIAPIDPSIEQATLPYLTRYTHKQFDVVTCFDVLEHLPDELSVTLAIDSLRYITNTTLFISVAWCADVRNVPGYGEMDLHLVKRPLGWWEDKINGRHMPIPGQPEWRAYFKVTK